MNVPIIGSQPKKEPPLRINIGPVNNCAIQIDMVLHEVDIRRATVDPNTAAAIMQQIGMAVESIMPGALIPALYQWIGELESAKSNGKKVLQELGMKGTP